MPVTSNMYDLGILWDVVCARDAEAVLLRVQHDEAEQSGSIVDVSSMIDIAQCVPFSMGADPGRPKEL